MHIVLVYPGFENLGIEYLSAALKLAGHRTSFAFDPTLFDDAFFYIPPLARLLSAERAVARRILALQPDLVAFGVMTPTFPWGLSLARRIRRTSDVPIVFGGIHPTTVPERVLANPEIDYVIRGEGEEAIVDLADALEAGRAISGIENLAYRDPADARVRVNPLRPLVADLDSLPFPDKDIYLREAEVFRLGYAIMAERGCSYSCSFCHHYNGKRLYAVSNDRYVRRRSVGNVLEELRQALARWNPGMVRFEDETFTYDWPWIQEFAERYPREIGLPFFCLGRPDTIHEEMVKALVHAGCREMEVGVQSFDPEIRKRVAFRGETDEQIRTTLRLCRRHGLKLDVDVILNLPGQTEEMLLRAFDGLVAHKPEGVNAFFASYYPGTAVLDIAVARGLLSPTDVEAILDGKTHQRPTQGGHSVERSIAKLGMLMILIPTLPAGLLRWLVAKRRYRWIPHPGFTGALVGAAVIGMVVQRFRGSTLGEKIDKFEAIRTPEKYLTYVVRKVWSRFREGRLGLEFRQPASVSGRGRPVDPQSVVVAGRPDAAIAALPG